MHAAKKKLNIYVILYGTKWRKRNSKKKKHGGSSKLS